jgi:hypothetical protein
LNQKQVRNSSALFFFKNLLAKKVYFFNVGNSGARVWEGGGALKLWASPERKYRQRSMETIRAATLQLP